MKNTLPCIALLCLNYPFENSPTIKGIASYLKHIGYNVDIVTGQYSSYDSIPVECSNVIRFMKIKIPKRVEKIFRPLIQKYKNNRYTNGWNKIKLNYDQIFCFELDSLIFVSNSGILLNKTIFFSMESSSSFSGIDKEYANSLLNKTCARIIQSKERENDLEAYLKKSFKWHYLPVSQRPTRFQKNKTNTKSNKTYLI